MWSLADDGTPRLTDFGVAYIESKERVTQDWLSCRNLGLYEPRST